MRERGRKGERDRKSEFGETGELISGNLSSATVEKDRVAAPAPGTAGRGRRVGTDEGKTNYGPII